MTGQNVILIKNGSLIALIYDIQSLDLKVKIGNAHTALSFKITRSQT